MPSIWQKKREPVLEHTAKGAFGIGKVRLQYFRKDDRARRINIFGPILFAIGAFFTAFIYSWNNPWLRDRVCIPLMRKGLHKYEALRSSYYQKQLIILDGITSNVTIQRNTESGHVHIVARSLPDAVFGQGYIHAHDRLFQMDLLRRKAQGTLAALIGDGGLYHDRIARTLNIHNLAKDDWETIATSKSTTTAEEAEVLRSYSAGINAYIAEEQTHMFRRLDYLTLPSFTAPYNRSLTPWTPADSLAILRLQAVESAHGWQEELTRAYLRETLPETSASEAVAELDPRDYCDHSLLAKRVTVLPSTRGQSAWIVGQDKTEHGMPFIASSFADTIASHEHLYANSLDFHYISGILSGASVPGVPLVMHGKNDFISWTYTHRANADTEDLYMESIKTFVSMHGVPPPRGVSLDDDNRAVIYKAKGIWKNAVTRKEIIQIHSKPHEELEVIETHHGPVITSVLNSAVDTASPSMGFSSTARTGEIRQLPLALCSQALRKSAARSFSFYFQLSRAKGWVDFTKAADTMEAESLNVLYSDVRGNTGYGITGTDVKRNSMHSGMLPVNVSTCSDDCDWIPEGKKGSSPSRHVLFEGGKGIIAAVDTSNPAVNYKLALVLNRATKGLKYDSLEHLLSDTYSVSAMHLVDLIHAVPIDSIIKDTMGVDMDKESLRKIALAQEITRRFDGHYKHDSSTPILLEGFRSALLERLMHPFVFNGKPHSPLAKANMHFRSDVPWLAGMLPVNVSEDDASWWVRQAGGHNTLVRSALLAAVTWYEKTQASGGTWGEFHAASYPYPINRHIMVFRTMSRGPYVQQGALDAMTQSGYTVERDWDGRREDAQDMSLFDRWHLNIQKGSKRKLALVAKYSTTMRMMSSFGAGGRGIRLAFPSALGQSESIGSRWFNALGAADKTAAKISFFETPPNYAAPAHMTILSPRTLETHQNVQQKEEL